MLPHLFVCTRMQSCLYVCDIFVPGTVQEHSDSIWSHLQGHRQQLPIDHMYNLCLPLLVAHCAATRVRGQSLGLYSMAPCQVCMAENSAV